MGEIKSTLDLVMEKTKNLNLSEKEKQDQRKKEIESRLNGLLQKFQDQIISREQFKAEYQSLREAHNIPRRQHKHLLKAICARIELGKDNQAPLDLLSQFSDSPIDGITSVLQEYDTAVQTAAAAQGQIAKDRLAREQFIAGSAVVPNLETDTEWQAMDNELRATFKGSLNQAKTKLLAG